MDKKNGSDMESARELFGFREFRGPQREIIDHVITGHHCLVLMPTGMGKSLCYQIPALLSDDLTLVLSPLIALMKDQVDALKARGIDAQFINSSLSSSERNSRYEKVRKGRYRLLYVSPERFRSAGFLSAIGERKVGLLAIDEAHCVSQWGHDFRPDYSRIGDFRKILGDPVTIALTATATARVQQDIIEKTGIDPRNMRIFNEGIYRHNLHLAVSHVLDETEKFEMMLEDISRGTGPAVVYFNLIKSIERFSGFCSQRGLRHMIYHGRMEPLKRRRVQEDFLASRSGVMLATNAFGMGIDKEDIRRVMHAEVPDSLESYYQEIGRAGRDGKPSSCHLYYCQDDLAVQIDFLQWKNPEAAFMKRTHQLLKSLEGHLVSYTYEDLQEKLVHKNRGDHRLETVLSLFDRYGVTTGSLDTHSLTLLSDLPEILAAGGYLQQKAEEDRRRLIAMVEYANTTGCRRAVIHRYFGAGEEDCGNCDNCR